MPLRAKRPSRLIAAGYGIVPAELTSGVLLPGYHPVPEPVTLITYMFLHAGWLHLISNLLFLWVFADNVEDAFGPWGFLVFYLICGIAGALTHTVLAPLLACTLDRCFRRRFRRSRRLYRTVSKGARLDPAAHANTLAHFGRLGAAAAGSCFRSSAFSLPARMTPTSPGGRILAVSSSAWR